MKPYSQTDVPLKSVWTTKPTAFANWLVEPKELKKGVNMARTLLPSDGSAVFARIVNCVPVLCIIREGEHLTNAEAINRLPLPATTSPTIRRKESAEDDVSHRPPAAGKATASDMNTSSIYLPH